MMRQSGNESDSLQRVVATIVDIMEVARGLNDAQREIYCCRIGAWGSQLPVDCMPQRIPL